MSEIEDTVKINEDEQSENEEEQEQEQEQDDDDDEQVIIEQDDDEIDDDDNDAEETDIVTGAKGTTTIDNNNSLIFDNDELEESDEEDYEYDEDMFKRIDENKDKYNNLHAESKIINKDELAILSKVTRNNDGFIVDDLHTTIPWLTKYEFSKLLGQRIKQLNEGNKPYISVETTAYIDNYNIAEQEIREKKLPFIIKRPMPNGGCEYWKLEDLQIIN